MEASPSPHMLASFAAAVFASPSTHGSCTKPGIAAGTMPPPSSGGTSTAGTSVGDLFSESAAPEDETLPMPTDVLVAKPDDMTDRLLESDESEGADAFESIFAPDGRDDECDAETAVIAALEAWVAVYWSPCKLSLWVPFRLQYSWGAEICSASDHNVIYGVALLHEHISHPTG